MNNYPAGVTADDIGPDLSPLDPEDCTLEECEFSEWEQWVEDGWYSRETLLEFFHDGYTPRQVQARMAAEIHHEQFQQDTNNF